MQQLSVILAESINLETDGFTLYTSYLVIMSSNSVYKAFSRFTTSIGVLLAQIDVKPTISEKYNVLSSKCSAFIGRPNLSSSATVLEEFSKILVDVVYFKKINCQRLATK